MRDGPYHQPLLGEPLHHHRDRARVGEGTPGKLGHRADGTFGQALEDEELCRAEAETRLGGPVGEPQDPDEPPQRPKGSGRRRRDFHGFPTNSTAGRIPQLTFRRQGGLSDASQLRKRTPSLTVNGPEMVSTPARPTRSRRSRMFSTPV